MKFRSLLTILIVTFICSPALAQTPLLLGKHGDWAAYSFQENGNKVCFMTSQPIKQQGNYTQRGQVYAMITHRPGDQKRDTVSFIAGYIYKTGSEVTAKVDGKTFHMFTQGDAAWTPDEDDDRRLASAIQRGRDMIVQGTSSRGTLTTDTYSLKGSSAAYRAITRACY